MLRRAAAVQMAVASVRRLTSRDEGQDLLEYGMLASLIAIFALGAVGLVGDQIYTVFWDAIANNF